MTEQQDRIDALNAARARLVTHKVLGPLARRVRVNRLPGNPCPPDARAVVAADGRIYANSHAELTVEEWLAVLAHLLLHLGLGHAEMHDDPAAWNAACDIVVARLMEHLGFPSDADAGRADLSLCGHEDSLYERFRKTGIPDRLPQPSTATRCDMLLQPTGKDQSCWTFWLGAGLRTGAVETMRRRTAQSRGTNAGAMSAAQQARSWFVSAYPLLGALASAFTIVEDVDVCRRAGIAIAAVHPSLREIYVNPAAGLDSDECRFVVAHELLHVGLLHHRRRGSRHPFLWNIACDYVINGWLAELGVGAMPAFGGYRDLGLRGLSAEAIYDRIKDRMKELRASGTFRGLGVGDILGDDVVDVSLDAFLRRCLVNGMEEHRRCGRGTLPAGLTEEVRGQLRRPIPWDVRLARWFDAHLAPHATRRSYVRPSRRQSATPDIPRPRVTPQEDVTHSFGVVLDTSSSMGRSTLAAALGSIAAYALAREVSAVRLVYCDATPYDQGYVEPETLLDWVDVRGRGGTVLQGAIDLLDKAPDFSPAGPILVVTDGLCDEISIRRDHAYLVPQGAGLAFETSAPIFEMAV